MKKVKFCALLLIVAMLLAMFAGCGSTTSATGSTSAVSSAVVDDDADVDVKEAPEADTAEPVDSDVEADSAESGEASTGEENAGTGVLSDALIGLDPVELPFENDGHTYTVWMATPSTVVGQTANLDEVNETWAELQARTGVDIVFQMANFFTQQDEFNLMAASGTMPEVMNAVATLYSAGPDKAIEDEILLNLLDYADYMPNYLALINANDSVRAKTYTTGGNIAGFYCLFDDDKYGRGDRGYLIRQDWLNDLGLDTPRTYDQLHDTLTAFKDDKGADAPFVLPVSGMDEYILNGFGVAATFYVEDDTIKFGPMEDGFREYLETMHQWYTEGLIYADFYSYSNTIMFDNTAMIGAGEVGLYFNETGTMITYSEYSNDPNFLLKAVPPVARNEGDTVYLTEFPPSYVDQVRWSITTNCENPEPIIQFADYCFSVEGTALCNWGIEGVTYEVVDGKKQLSDLILNSPDYAFRDACFMHIIDGMGFVYDPLRGASNYTEEQLSSWDDWTDANIDYSRALPSSDMMNAEEKSEYAGIYSDIDTYLDEVIVKYIIGDMSFDTYETDMVRKLESMNIARVLELYQGAYERFVG